MEGFNYRDAHYGDLCQVATLLAKAFWDDPLFGDLIHPHRNQYPADTHLWWLRRARVLFWDRHRKWLIATRSIDGEEVIAGIAQWERLGDGGKKADYWLFDPRNLLKPPLASAMKVHAVIWPNKACNPEYEDILERAQPYSKTLWSGDREESWYLDWLAVRPDFQRMGIGRKLVQWGLDQAAKDEICASVISALGKDGFYQDCGFDELKGSASMGVGNPLAAADVPGGNIWWRMPK
ncbi:acyl-CoA N-acyltransferase [Xylariales sp. AK1849]|nr:acyl-CoA N-acyltransferase [Xylariales sp. AK1849]